MTLAMLELKGPFNLENLDIRNEEAVFLITLHGYTTKILSIS